MEYRNPIYTETGDIDCEINHPTYGWIPFTASADDAEEHGRSIFEDAVSVAALYVVPAPILPTLTQRKTEVDALREQAVSQGLEYQFTDSAGVIQLRNESDIRNVMGIATTGQALAALGSSDTLSFRDAGNVTHTLVPADAILMGLAVSGFISECYATAWNHKDAISALTGQPLADYDITTGWSV